MSINEAGVRIADPDTSYSDNHHVGYRTAGLTISAEYTNFTGIDLYLKTQNNLPFVVEPNTQQICSAETRPHLEVKITYHLHNNDSILRTMETLVALRANSSLHGLDINALIAKIMKLYESDASKNNKLNFKFMVYKRVLLDDLIRSDTLYLRECDLIVARSRAQMGMPHPNSSEGMHRTEVMSNKKLMGLTGIFTRVVDNENLAKVRYYYAGKHLITVPSDHAQDKASGVYCTISTTASDGVVSQQEIFMTFEEAQERIGLYRTQDDALSHGDPEIALRAEEARNKSEEARSKLEASRLSRELAEVKHRSEMAALQKEEELTRIRHSLEITKAENGQLKESLEIRKVAREDGYDVVKKKRDDKFEKRKKSREDRYDDRDKYRKDYYDRRSYERKDSSELIKFIPGLAIGLLTAFALVRSGSSK